jgi:tRNA dimethylallyltransferase
VPPDPATFRDCLILTGPTGSGKSALALDLAERIDAEIIALDSMTLYRGMDIGTAKPTPDEQRRVRHHLIDVLDPSESASVAWYLEQASQCVADIRQRGKRPLFVGGTPFYLKAMLFGLFDSPPTDASVRRRWETMAETEGGEKLHRQLQQVDPITAARLHPNDVRRVVRALEVFELTGQPISSLQQQWDGQPTQRARLLCVEMDRELLYHRINRRVEAMMAAGWLEEVRQLRQRWPNLSREAGKALGYRELGRVLDGQTTLAEAVNLIQMRSRQFAKRQMTWFRHLPGLQFVRPELTLLIEASTIE